MSGRLSLPIRPLLRHFVESGQRDNGSTNKWIRFVWPVGLLVVFVGLFAVVLSTARYGFDVFDIGFGQRFLKIEFGGSAGGGPLRPIRLPLGARVQQNVSYGSHRLQKLDVYIPPGNAGGMGGIPPTIAGPTEAGDGDGAPILFMVHGGGWQRGDKTARGTVQNKINYFLPRGYMFVSVNYRLGPEVDPATQVDDVAAALAYVQRHAANWGGDGSRIVLMGHSAGAHLVTMLTSAPEIGQRLGVEPWLGTVSLDSAAYNVVELMGNRHRSLYDRAFGNDPLFWELTSPALRLHSAPPPMLLVCSTRWAHSCQQAVAYAEAVGSFGGTITLERVALRHNDVNRRVGVPGRLTDAIVNFMRTLGLQG